MRPYAAVALSILVGCTLLASDRLKLPVGAACDGDDQCQAAICTDRRCATRCTTRADCLSPTTCVTGFCRYECALPSEGAARLRLGNLVTGDERVDMCIRPTEGDWRSIFASPGCSGGIGYAELSAQFAIPSGAIDVKVVPKGANCTATPLSHVEGVPVAADVPSTVVRVGGGPRPEALLVLKDATPPNDATTKLRFVHAMVGAPPLTLGTMSDWRLPAELLRPLLLEAVAFGKTPRTGAPAEFGSVDDKGYLSMGVVEWSLGLAEEGASRGLVAFHVPMQSIFRTLYAIGDATSTTFPPRGLLCEDGADPTSLLTTCVPTELPTLAADVFRAVLSGTTLADEEPRRPYIVDAMSRHSSDIFCLTDVARPSDRDAIATAAKESYPYAYTITTTLDTAPTSPEDADGGIPAAPSSPPCSAVEPAKVDAMLQCLSDRCSTKPGDPTGIFAGGSGCASSQCLSPGLALYRGNRDERRCWGCIAIEANSEMTYAQNRELCTNDRHDPLAFGGVVQQLLLSHLPLSSSEAFVLPSTFFRRVALFSRAETETGRSIDVYCVQLSPVYDGLFPYTGSYGGGDDTRGWANEQLLQERKVVQWIKQKSAGRPALILGDWGAALGVLGSDGKKLLDDVNPDVIRELRAAFAEATPRNWTPLCTNCPKSQNPYNGDITGFWDQRTYLLNFAADSTVAASTFFTERVVPLSSGEKGPLSPRFGFNVRVLRP